MVEFRQGFRSMAAPTRELEKLIVARRLAHGANPVTRWMAANVAGAQDPAGNLKPARCKSTDRIDGIVAIVMALGRAMLPEEPARAYQVLILGQQRVVHAPDKPDEPRHDGARVELGEMLNAMLNIPHATAALCQGHAARAVQPVADLHPAARADLGQAHLMTAFAEAVDATFEAFGIDAVYTPAGGEPVSVRVIAGRLDTIVGFGETRIHTETATFEVRASEVADPRPGDQLTVDGDTFVIQGEPERGDPDRLVWSLDVRPA